MPKKPDSEPGRGEARDQPTGAVAVECNVVVRLGRSELSK